MAGFPVDPSSVTAEWLGDALGADVRDCRLASAVWLRDERSDYPCCFAKRGRPDAADRVVERGSGKPLHELRQKCALRLFDGDHHRHRAVRQSARDKRAGDDTPGIGGEMEGVGQHRNVQLVVAVAAWRDVAGVDHKSAARLARYTFSA